MLLRRRNIKLVKKVLESMSSKNRNLLNTCSILDMKVNNVNVNRMIGLLNSFDIRGLLWEDPLPLDKHRRQGHICTLKPKQLYWNYCTAHISVSEAGPHTTAFSGNG